MYYSWVTKKRRQQRRRAGIPDRSPKRRLRKKDREKIKKAWWELRFHETVVWELKRLHLERKIEKTEEKLATILNLPMEITNLKSATDEQENGILDSGAMRCSGDASKSEHGRATRTPMEEKLGVRGVHGASKTVTHEFELKVPSAVPNKDVVFNNAIDIPGSTHNLISVGKLDDAGMTTVFKDGEGKVFDKEDKLVMYAKKVDGLYRLRVRMTVKSDL